MTGRRALACLPHALDDGPHWATWRDQMLRGGMTQIGGPLYRHNTR